MTECKNYRTISQLGKVRMIILIKRLKDPQERIPEWWASRIWKRLEEQVEFRKDWSTMQQMLVLRLLAWFMLINCECPNWVVEKLSKCTVKMIFIKMKQQTIKCKGHEQHLERTNREHNERYISIASHPFITNNIPSHYS